jgi:Transglutaminase-like superfamily
MQENKEILALLSLIDDPDAEVFENVSNKIVSFGKSILPNLEHFGEGIQDDALQQKVTGLIRRLHFSSLLEEVVDWKNSNHNLLEGTLLVSKYLYPNEDIGFVYKEIEKLRRNVWLELNSYLTPIEQANVLSGILFSYFQLRGVELRYDTPDNFLTSKTLETRHGNAYGNGVLILLLGALLDLPLKAINIPNQFILGYFDLSYDSMYPKGNPAEKIKFFVDPLNGHFYTHSDVDNYLKKMGLAPSPVFYQPFSSLDIVVRLFKEVGKCFDRKTQADQIAEINQLTELLVLE